MMNIWHDLSPERVKETDFDAVIEITKGGKAKYLEDPFNENVDNYVDHIRKKAGDAIK